MEFSIEERQVLTRLLRNAILHITKDVMLLKSNINIEMFETNILMYIKILKKVYVPEIFEEDDENE
jgi:hypothetical protein